MNGISALFAGRLPLVLKVRYYSRDVYSGAIAQVLLQFWMMMTDMAPGGAFSAAIRSVSCPGLACVAIITLSDRINERETPCRSRAQ